jgi:hypothetical protein
VLFVPELPAYWNSRRLSRFSARVRLIEIEVSSSCALQLLHHFHQTSGHEEGLSHSVVDLAVLAETDEDGIDCHLEDGHEAMNDQPGENDTDEDWNERVVDMWGSLWEKMN